MIFLETILKIINKYFILPFDISLKVNSFSLFANKPDRILAILLWKFGFLEKNEINILRKIIKPNMYVLDIGANIGLYTTIFSTLVGEKGKVFAFEPEQNNFRLLNKSIKKNKIKNANLYNFAVSDSIGKGTLFVSKINSGDNRLESSTRIHEKFQISKIKLDDFSMIPKHIDFIKMDIQGGEYKALCGMKNILLSNSNLIILIELDVEMVSLSNLKIAQLLKFLKDYFNFCYLVKSKMIHHERNIIEYIDNKNYRYENIIFSKKNIMINE